MANKELFLANDVFSLDTACGIEERCSTLSRIVDAVAALSCEATRADVTTFSSLDGDKDAIAVAGDMNVLLKESGLVGKQQVEAVLKIPRIHGNFRLVLKNLRAEVEGLSPSIEGSSVNSGLVEVLATRLASLSLALRNMGECSFIRAKLSMESIVNEDLRTLLSNYSPDYDRLKNLVKETHDSLFDNKYMNFAHLVSESLDIVYRIVGWEAASALFTLQGGQVLSVVNGNVEEPKTDKMKKKKAVLGKGTNALVQFIKDSLLGQDISLGDEVETLKQCVEKVLSLFEPYGTGVACFFDKVIEIVENNEDRQESSKAPKGYS